MRTTLALAAVCGVVLAAPAAAGAKTWRGKTAQDRAVMVRTGGDDLVNRVRISWRAQCRKGNYTSTTMFVPPFDAASTTAFEDEGTYRVRIPGGYRARHTAFVSASLDANGRLARHVPRADAGDAKGQVRRQLPAQALCAGRPRRGEDA